MAISSTVRVCGMLFYSGSRGLTGELPTWLRGCRPPGLRDLRTGAHRSLRLIFPGKPRACLSDSLAGESQENCVKTPSETTEPPRSQRNSQRKAMEHVAGRSCAAWTHPGWAAACRYFQGKQSRNAVPDLAARMWCRRLACSVLPLSSPSLSGQSHRVATL